MTDTLTPLVANFARPAVEIIAGLAALSPNELADVLELSRIMRHEIRPLWSPDMPRICGPAFTVRTGRHDNLMLHAAIYLAQPGDVLVVEGGDDEMALAGGNVCAIAHGRGVIGLVADGVVRDIPESRDRKFPIFGRGISPIPGKRVGDGGVGVQIRCGGIVVDPGDVIVADENGIVVVPQARAADVLAKARTKADADAKLTLDAWGARHRANVETALRTRGLTLGS